MWIASSLYARESLSKLPRENLCRLCAQKCLEWSATDVEENLEYLLELEAWHMLHIIYFVILRFWKIMQL